MAARLKHAPSLHQLKVTVPRDAEEAAGLVIESLFGEWPVGFSQPESNQTELSLFLSADQRPSRSDIEELETRLRDLRAAGFAMGQPKVRLAPLANRDWKHSWKRHFKPMEIGGQLLVRPSWSRRRAKPGQAVVILDPGLSFGTGQHPTTGFCLRELVRSRREKAGQTFLDIGTGSGILAIAAAKLGYRPVHAFDSDPAAVRVASDNARRNRVEGRIRFQTKDLSKLPDRPRRRHDVVCANLLGDLLIREAARILHRAKPGGLLLIAGILRTEFTEVQSHFVTRGACCLRSCTEGEWQSGAYRVLA